MSASIWGAEGKVINPLNLEFFISSLDTEKQSIKS